MFKKLIVFIGLAGLCLNLCGCVTLVAGAAAGAGTAYWLSEKLTQSVNAPYDRTIQATHSGLNELKYPITKETKNKKITQIMSKDSKGRTIWIDITPTTETTSSIAVRVGAQGDKPASQNILTKISAYL